jgi:hypothetical protein
MSVPAGGHIPRGQSNTERPAEIPAAKGLCGECGTAVASDTRYAAMITVRALPASDGDGPQQWMVAACSAEHLQLVIDRGRGAVR